MPHPAPNPPRTVPATGILRRVFFQCLELFVIAILLAPALRADEFAAGKAAYDAGKFAEAETRYRAERAAGKLSPELFFNLGNAEFKQGEPGEAVLNYRRAWMLAPRDPDIRANLHFALERANAAGSGLSLPARAFTRASETEWGLIAIASYWLAAALVIAWLLGLRRISVLRAAAALALLGVVALAGVLQWRSLHRTPELVVLEKTQALFGPIVDATRKFELPEGSIVREVTREGDWVNIESGGETGWLQSKHAARVYPWK